MGGVLTKPLSRSTLRLLVIVPVIALWLAVVSYVVAAVVRGGRSQEHHPAAVEQPSVERPSVEPEEPAVPTRPNRCPDGTKKRKPEKVWKCNRTCSGPHFSAMESYNCMEKCRCPASPETIGYEPHPTTCRDGRAKLGWKDASLAPCNARCDSLDLSAGDLYDCIDACRCPKLTDEDVSHGGP